VEDVRRYNSTKRLDRASKSAEVKLRGSALMKMVYLMVCLRRTVPYRYSVWRVRAELKQ
jgi:hypothetical protein